MKIIKALLVSLILTLISELLPVMAGMYIPFYLDEHEPSVGPLKQIYSMAEIDAAEEKMKKSMATARQDVQKLTKLQVLERVRKQFLWITWIPWVLLAFLVRPMNLTIYLVALALPLFFVLVDLILPMEMVFYCLAAAVGTALYRLLQQRRIPRGPDVN